MNNHGDVVGRTRTGRAFVNRDGVMQELLIGDTPHFSGGAVGINDSGQIVGVSTSKDSFNRAFLYEDGSMRDLGALPGLTSSEAKAINNRGQVVGNSRNRAFLWEENTGMTEIGWLDDSIPSSSAEAINNVGEVVGRSFIRVNGQTFLRAYLWRRGQMEELPPLPGDQFSEAYDVNDSGQVVGISLGCNPYCSMRPVLWDGDDIIELGGIDGASAGFNKATGINNRGQVVGISDLEGSPGTSLGFLAEPLGVR